MTEKVRQNLSPKAVEHARGFLSALFMALRTAQIHDPSNAAFGNAIDAVHRSAEQLYASTGGFQIQFVEESAFLNGVRLRFASGTYMTMRSLRNMLEEAELGGITLQSQPTRKAIRTLIMLVSKVDTEPASAAELEAAQIGLLGVQTFSDSNKDYRVDRRIFAVQCYAKLILALTEQIERAKEMEAAAFMARSAPPRLRVVRVLQDVVELCGDRADFVLRLALNTTGADPEILRGVNTALLSVAMGSAIGLTREQLVDVGLGALFHGIGTRAQAIAWMMQEGGVSESADIRTIIVAECAPGADVDQLHPLSEIVQVASAFSAYHLDPKSAEAPEILAHIFREGGFSARIVDLLINVLRTFPVGVDVMLDVEGPARVKTQLGSARWDRPIVMPDATKEKVDLMLRDGGRFSDRIAGTLRYLGKQTGKLDELDLPPPVELDASALSVVDESPELLSPEHLLEVPASPGEVLEAGVVGLVYDDDDDLELELEDDEPEMIDPSLLDDLDEDDLMPDGLPPGLLDRALDSDLSVPEDPHEDTLDGDTLPPFPEEETDPPLPTLDPGALTSLEEMPDRTEEAPAPLELDASALTPVIEPTAQGPMPAPPEIELEEGEPLELDTDPPVQPVPLEEEEKVETSVRKAGQAKERIRVRGVKLPTRSSRPKPAERSGSFGDVSVTGKPDAEE